MIDYEKLRRAHELCISGGDYYFTVDFGVPLGFIYLHDLSLDAKSPIIAFRSIDKLITKLEELTQPEIEPKYKVGDVVWQAGFCNEITSWVVAEVQPDDNHTYCYRHDNHSGWFEHQLYPTREALIQSQIEHWQGLSEESTRILSMQAVGEYVDSTIKCEHKQETRSADGVNYLCLDCDQWFTVPEVCEHEPSDDAQLLNVGTYNCKKCGEFYR